jgi:hypothetical protein
MISSPRKLHLIKAIGGPRLRNYLLVNRVLPMAFIQYIFSNLVNFCDEANGYLFEP